METKEAVEVEVIDIKTELQVFDPVVQAITEAKEKNASIVFDYADKQGNKEARSWIAQLRKLKAPLNEVHKLQKAQAKKLCDALDGEKRKYMGVIEEMINVHHEPIWEIEQRELAIEAEKMAEELAKKEAEEAARLAEIEARGRAVAEKEAALLMKEATLRQKDREREIAEEAAENERQRIREEMANREEQATQAATDAENRRLADIQREKDKAAAEAADKERVIAEEKEKDRMYALELESQEKERQANTAHRLKIHNAIYAKLKTFTITEHDAQAIFRAIKDNEIPHVTIQY